MKYIGEGLVQTVFGETCVPLPKSNPFGSFDECQGIVKFVSCGEMVDVYDCKYKNFYKVKTKGGDEGYLLKCLVIFKNSEKSKLNNKRKKFQYYLGLGVIKAKTKTVEILDSSCSDNLNYITIQNSQKVDVFDIKSDDYYYIVTKSKEDTLKGYIRKEFIDLNLLEWEDKNKLYLCDFKYGCSNSAGCILNGGECKATTNKKHALLKDKSIIKDHYYFIDPKPEHGKLYQVIMQNKDGEINDFPVFAEYLNKTWYYYDPMSGHSKEILTDFGCKVLHWKAVNTDF